MATGATISRNIGASVVMDTKGLTSLSGSSTSVGWQSEVVDDTTIAAVDYQINMTLAMGASAPGGDKVLYAYAVPWYSTGSTWYVNSLGTTTPLSKSTTGGAATIGVPENNLGIPKIINYNAANEIVNVTYNLSQFFGDTMPDGWQIVLINNCTATVLTSATNTLNYKSIKWNSITT